MKPLRRKKGREKYIYLGLLFLVAMAVWPFLHSMFDRDENDGSDPGHDTRKVAQTPSTEETDTNNKPEEETQAPDNADDGNQTAQSERNADGTEERNRSVRRVWTAFVNRNWFDHNNWKPGGVPDRNDTVVIPDDVRDLPFPILSSRTGQVGTLIVDRWAGITVNEGGTLEIQQSLKIKGALDARRGTVIVHGTRNQQIPGGEYGTLVLDVEGTVHLAPGVSIRKDLHTNAGTDIHVEAGNVPVHGRFVRSGAETPPSLIDPSFANARSFVQFLNETETTEREPAESEPDQQKKASLQVPDNR